MAAMKKRLRVISSVLNEVAKRGASQLDGEDDDVRVPGSSMKLRSVELRNFSAVPVHGLSAPSSMKLRSVELRNVAGVYE